MSEPEVVPENRERKAEMVCTKNATHDEKSSGRALAFSIDSIMSDQRKPGVGSATKTVDKTTHLGDTDAITPEAEVVATHHHHNKPEVLDSIMSDRTKPGGSAVSRSTKTVDRTTHLGDTDAITPEPEVVVINRHHKPEVLSRNDAVVRYHLQQQKMKIANAVMLHMATGSSMASDVGRLFPAARHPEMLLRQYQRHPYHLQSNVLHADQYDQNTTNITSFPVDRVTSSFSRCRLPVSSDVAWSPSRRNSEYHSIDKPPKFMTESLFSPSRPTIGRKRTLYDEDDVTDWSQMAAGSLHRRCSSPTGSQQSVISGCSAERDEEEIVVDDDVEDDRKQFSPSCELPVELGEAPHDISGDTSWTGKTIDRDIEGSPEACLNSTAWSVPFSL